MSISLTGATNGEVVDLVTPPMPPTINACNVRFYYYLAGASTGGVSVGHSFVCVCARSRVCVHVINNGWTQITSRHLFPRLDLVF